MIMGTLTGHGTLLQRIYKCLLKSVSAIVKHIIINHGLMRIVQNWLIEGTTVVADPSVMNEDNLSNIRWEASRHFRNKERQYLKDKINELETNSKNKNIRDLYTGINEFKKGYQPRTNLVKDEKGDLLADPHKIVNIWMNYFGQILNVQQVVGIRQTEIQTAEPFVPEPSITEVEVTTGKLTIYKSPGADHIPAEVIQAGWEKLHSEIHKLIKLIWNKEELPHQRKESIVVPIHKKVI
jgi:hypothetical protein